MALDDRLKAAWVRRIVGTPSRQIHRADHAFATLVEELKSPGLSEVVFGLSWSHHCAIVASVAGRPASASKPCALVTARRLRGLKAAPQDVEIEVIEPVEMVACTSQVQELASPQQIGLGS